MNSEKFVKACKNVVTEYMTRKHEIDNNEFDIYVVWLSKTLQNSKALLSTSYQSEEYFELTYNGDKHELYLDVYDKVKNEAITLD